METICFVDLVKKIKWNDKGLVVAIAQDYLSKQVLMQAWINHESLKQTLEQGFAVYWSRSRQQLWKKGESSGHLQKIIAIDLDCDSDTLLFQVQQTGVACHTGSVSCFFKNVYKTSI